MKTLKHVQKHAPTQYCHIHIGTQVDKYIKTPYIHIHTHTLTYAHTVTDENLSLVKASRASKVDNTEKVSNS